MMKIKISKKTQIRLNSLLSEKNHLDSLINEIIQTIAAMKDAPEDARILLSADRSELIIEPKIKEDEKRISDKVEK